MIFFNLSIYTNEASTITRDKRHNVYLGNPHGEENPANFFNIDSSTKYNANTMLRTNDLSHREITPRTNTNTRNPNG